MEVAPNQRARPQVVPQKRVEAERANEETVHGAERRQGLENLVISVRLLRKVRRFDKSNAPKRNAEYLDFAQIPEQWTILPQEKSVTGHGAFIAQEVSSQ